MPLAPGTRLGLYEIVAPIGAGTDYLVLRAPCDGRGRLTVMGVPPRLHWLFWEVEPNDVDVEHHADYVIARIVERGRMEDVDWMIATYGDDRVHRFFRDVGHPELSPRTLSFWRAYFRAKDQRWADTAAWRRSSSAPWIS